MPSHLARPSSSKISPRRSSAAPEPTLDHSFGFPAFRIPARFAASFSSSMNSWAMRSGSRRISFIAPSLGTVT